MTRPRTWFWVRFERPVDRWLVWHFRYPLAVMDMRETMNVGLGRTSLVVAASDGPGG